MEIIEIIAWIALGFVPMFGSMELAWRLQLRKRFAKPELEATGETSFVEVNRRLTKLLPPVESDRLWLREA
ncbi:MAG TPA: hypothetical protein VE548_15465 [Nitrososphaeraceae archaeon]|jgi:hypothetical protein|nr:hypothetical protein [Nitrososphaeraceae archaeon]